MKFSIKYPSLIFFSSLILISLPSRAEDRLDIINKELDCVSVSKEVGKVEWNDVCYTSEDFRERTVNKTLDDTIEDHEEMADEMLNDENVPGEPQEEEPRRTVDDVYRTQSDYWGVTSGDSAVRAKERKRQERDDTTDELEDDEDAGTYNEIGEDDSDSPGASYDDGEDDRMQIARADNRRNRDDDYYDDEDRSTSRMKRDAPPADRLERALYNSDRTETVRTLGLGIELLGYNYKEPSLGVELDGNGPFYGGYLNYTVRPGHNNTLFEDIVDVYTVDLSLNHGFTNYSSDSGILDNQSNFVFEARGLAGKDLMISENTRLTPYTGFGYRYLKHDFGDPLNGPPYGYDRESRYLYLPLGLEFATPLIDRWMLVPNLELDVLLIGWQKSHLSDIPGYYGDLDNTQNGGYGFRGSVKLIKQGDRMDYVIEPFFRYWYIEDSDIVYDSFGGGFEPRNKTTEVGVRLGAQF